MRAIAVTPISMLHGGTALVQIRSANDDALRIDSIETSLPALTSRWAAGPGNRATVRIGLDRAKWDGRPSDGEVRVRLSAPAPETLVIPVSVRRDE